MSLVVTQGFLSVSRTILLTGFLAGILRGLTSLCGVSTFDGVLHHEDPQYFRYGPMHPSVLVMKPLISIQVRQLCLRHSGDDYLRRPSSLYCDWEAPIISQKLSQVRQPLDWNLLEVLRTFLSQHYFPSVFGTPLFWLHAGTRYTSFYLYINFTYTKYIICECTA